MASLQSVRRFAERWGDRPLHVLVNNAGIFNFSGGATPPPPPFPPGPHWGVRDRGMSRPICLALSRAADHLPSVGTRHRASWHKFLRAVPQEEEYCCVRAERRSQRCAEVLRGRPVSGLSGAAGRVAAAWDATEEGLEAHFATNCLGPHLLTLLLLPAMRAAAEAPPHPPPPRLPPPPPARPPPPPPSRSLVRNLAGDCDVRSKARTAAVLWRVRSNWSGHIATCHQVHATNSRCRDNRNSLSHALTKAVRSPCRLSGAVSTLFLDK